MMQRLHKEADEIPITLNLSDIFDDFTMEMSEVDTQEVPDDILREILIAESSINSLLSETKSDGIVSHRSTPVSTPKSNNRFKANSKKDVDDIASKSCTKKTQKQTTWGVKVFRGTYNNFHLISLNQKLYCDACSL